MENRPCELGGFLKNRLPGYVRAAASKFRSDCVSIEDCEPFLFDCSSGGEFGRAELEASIRSVLTPAEFATAVALADGATQKEIAAAEGVSQQRIAQRLAKMRVKLLSAA